MNVTNAGLLRALQGNDRLQEERHQNVLKTLDELKSTVKENRVVAEKRHEKLARKVYLIMGVGVGIETLWTLLKH